MGGGGRFTSVQYLYGSDDCPEWDTLWAELQTLTCRRWFLLRAWWSPPGCALGRVPWGSAASLLAAAPQWARGAECVRWHCWGWGGPALPLPRGNSPFWGWAKPWSRVCTGCRRRKGPLTDGIPASVCSSPPCTHSRTWSRAWTLTPGPAPLPCARGAATRCCSGSLPPPLAGWQTSPLARWPRSNSGQWAARTGRTCPAGSRSGTGSTPCWCTAKPWPERPGIGEWRRGEEKDGLQIRKLPCTKRPSPCESGGFLCGFLHGRVQIRNIRGEISEPAHDCSPPSLPPSLSLPLPVSPCLPLSLCYCCCCWDAALEIHLTCPQWPLPGPVSRRQRQGAGTETQCEPHAHGISNNLYPPFKKNVCHDLLAHYRFPAPSADRPLLVVYNQYRTEAGQTCTIMAQYPRIVWFIKHTGSSAAFQLCCKRCRDLHSAAAGCKFG